MYAIKKLTVGPIVGHADDHHVRIWGRADYQPLASGEPRRAFGIARLRSKSSDRYDSPHLLKMNPNFDMSGVVIFHKLKPDTQYVYQIGWFFSDRELEDIKPDDQWDWHDADQGEFATASNDHEAEREFIFGSCRYLLRLFNNSWFESRGDKTFRSILEQKRHRPIHKFLMLGDQIYADDLNVLGADNRIDQFFSRYRDAFSQPYIKQLMSQVSTYMTLDDHEIEDNWPSNASDCDLVRKYPSALHAYHVYQASHSSILPIDPDTGRLSGTIDRHYYRFNDGCCEFFVTDTRTERLLDDDPEEREIISDPQMTELLAWLADGSDRVKLVVTTVPFFPDTKKKGGDRWSGFQRQRDQIIAQIRHHRLKKVVFLSGDVHCSMSAELDISEGEEPTQKIYSVISSAFYWPYPHTQGRTFQLTGSLKSLSNPNTYRLGQVSKVYSGDNFSRVRVTPSGLEVSVYERKGKLIYDKVRYHFDG